ncbi:hypothetical protein THASP1DRAFT_33444 [Thamnocephalis sphaerospora]|uniref:Protein kinase domain-containing protein n=1 Tax=Thamnocephalis sphaerospora TaxID=78915 RepID=A0A4P9XGI3_9FUNG|nr:hypothetical protein THASP1DRAFT_33444 [Thamnocephalis sphaerospora]|eukprot:RKP04753.1 hypothetical protein THASP1DRAFT_33444 [Thamnocephalis sphaerospora]
MIITDNSDDMLRVVLIDFGSAELINDSMCRRDMMRSTGGTKDFEAPENSGCDLKPAADVYSLGATLHHFMQAKDIQCEAMDDLIATMVDPAPENRPRACDVVEKARAIQQKLKPTIFGFCGMSSASTIYASETTDNTPTKHHIFYDTMV